MPTFDPKPGEGLEEIDERVKGALERVSTKAGPELIVEPRCRVCQSPHRHYVDSLLVKGFNYSKIASRVPSSNGRKLDRRSVGRHAKLHLDVESGAMRELLEHEAEQAGQNYVEGVRGAITHRGVLEATLRQGFEKVVNGDAEIEVRDLVQIVQTMQKMDTDTETVQVDQMKAELQAFLQAIREVVPKQYWAPLATRARQIARGDIGDITEEEEPIVPELVEAEIVAP